MHLATLEGAISFYSSRSEYLLPWEECKEEGQDEVAVSCAALHGTCHPCPPVPEPSDVKAGESSREALTSSLPLLQGISLSRLQNDPFEFWSCAGVLAPVPWQERAFAGIRPRTAWETLGPLMLLPALPTPSCSKEPAWPCQHHGHWESISLKQGKQETEREQ